jgi:4a-hydroxytetrahydrobiopterin dehydratase
VEDEDEAVTERRQRLGAHAHEAQRAARACRLVAQGGGIPPLNTQEAECFHRAPAMRPVRRSAAHRANFKFHNFVNALKFVQRVGKLAEVEGHHADIALDWGYACASLETKRIKGVHDNDFIIMAAKIGKVGGRVS